jgi:hypothetical protein
MMPTDHVPAEVRDVLRRASIRNAREASAATGLAWFVAVILVMWVVKEAPNPSPGGLASCAGLAGLLLTADHARRRLRRAEALSSGGGPRALVREAALLRSAPVWLCLPTIVSGELVILGTSRSAFSVSFACFYFLVFTAVAIGNYSRSRHVAELANRLAMHPYRA